MSNMYEDMTDENKNPLRGECQHKCTYCYVNAMKQRLPGMKGKYSGKPKIDKNVISKSVIGGTRFLCSCNDLFASDVTNEAIADILDWATAQETVTWWIQTKNPCHPIFEALTYDRPDNFVLGITLETNRDTSKISSAPIPTNRKTYWVNYVTIEPIMKFDLEEFVQLIINTGAEFINIGADSGDNGLPEPTEEEVYALINELERNDFEVKLKSNLKRIAPKLFMDTPQLQEDAEATTSPMGDPTGNITGGYQASADAQMSNDTSDNRTDVNTIPQARNYQCDRCKGIFCHKDMYNDELCYSCYDKEEGENNDT